MQALLLWQDDPSVLEVEASPVASGHPDAFDLTAISEMATVLVLADGGERLVLSDGYRRIRIDVVQGTVLRGPVRLRFLLEGFHGLDPRIATLQRFIALRKLGRFRGGLHPRERFAPRWIAALRVDDALYAGASQRDIAHYLFGAMAGDSDWRDGSDFLRLRVQRLVRAGRQMGSGGYRILLR